MIKEYRLKIEEINNLDDELKIRYRNLFNSLILFSISNEYKSFLISREFDFNNEIMNQFKIGFYENIKWLFSQNVIDDNLERTFSEFQTDVENLFSLKWKYEDITLANNWSIINNSASLLLQKLDEKRTKFDFEDRYIIVDEKIEESLALRIKKYFVPFLSFFIFLTILSFLPSLQKTNKYDNPFYIFPLISFIGSVILFLSIILIQEIAKPKREKINLNKLQKLILKDMNLTFEDHFVECYYKDFLCRFKWDNWNTFNNFRSSLFIHIFFNNEEIDLEEVKLKNKRLELFNNNFRMIMTSGYYKLPKKQIIIETLDNMIKILTEENLKPISREQLEIEMLINIVKRNEYEYREEHIYK